MTPVSTPKTSKPKGYAGPVGAWVGEIAERMLDDLARLGDVVSLSKAGVRLAQNMPKVVHAISLAKPHFGTPSSPEDREQRVAKAAKQAALGKREEESDYAILNSMVVVAICAHLEFFVRNISEGFFQHHRRIWKEAALQRLNIRLGDYLGTPSARRYSLIVELLERDLMTESRYGVDRFERILEVFGLAGRTPPAVKKVLYELFSVRNLIAHNAGRIDRRFKGECPWLKGKVGQPHHVSSGLIDVYVNAVTLYLTVIVCRWGRRRGADMSKAEEYCEEGGQQLGERHVLEIKRATLRQQTKTKSAPAAVRRRNQNEVRK